jgi:hypothetical protein
MAHRKQLRTAVVLGLTGVSSVALTGVLTGLAAVPAAALAARPTPTCVYLVAHLPPTSGLAGYTRVRNRCATGRYVKVVYSNRQARVGTCLRAGSTYSFSLPWKYRPYRGVRVKALTEQPKTC